ncbi:protein EARLY FLOWERING 3-like [Cornus florida]|uniref:protein EARLY FLOWERING 3-like n=1 Tax=Cornus florida TaxID=4283 RepID=UPI0028971234|nr:protein EARLY FLOWERING 3-like [Cornus florida]
MMKGGKIEEKLISPLFPRLHINDAEKGGPRAPPRNKMALCEQLSVPSQRFASGSASMLPLPPNTSCNLAPSTSLSHVRSISYKGFCSLSSGGPEMSLYSPFCNSPVSPHLAERLHSYSSGGVNFNTTLTNLERQPEKPTNDQILSATGHFSTASKCSFLRQHGFLNSRNSSVKKLDDKDHLRVLASGQLGRTPNCSNSWQNMDKEKLISSGTNSPKNLQISCEKQKKRTSTTDLNLRPHLRIGTEEKPEESQTSQPSGKNHASILLNGDKILVDASSSPRDRDRISEQAKGGLFFFNLGKRNNLAADISRLNDSNSQLHQECEVLQEKNVLIDDASAKPKKAIEKINASISEGLSCPRPSLGDNRQGPNRIKNASEFHEDWQSGSSQAGDVDRNIDVSDTSMVDSISSLDISPDDVVQVIGQKQFWKARRAIVHQQRAFAVQLFELHRLIKVQRLIARSPDLLLENNLYLGTTSMEVSPAKKFRSNYVLEPPPSIAKQKEDSQKPNPTNECSVEKAVRNPRPSLNSDTNKICVTQQSKCEPYSRNAAPAAVASNAKPAPWCSSPPPGNQWLVPVISPSEGLVYKPYAGPCPPTAGFIAPVYGSYEPMSLTPEGGDFLNKAHGIPFPHQQGIVTLPGTLPPDQTYFPPYGMPLMKPSVSRSAVEQTNPFPRAESNKQDNQLCVGDLNFIPYKSSFNIASQKSGVISYCVRKLQASKESESQGCTASSPEMEKRDPLPLFPTSPQSQASDQPARTHTADEQTRVIKVVPHNPRAAFESAARIFQSIQEERKQ